VGSQIWYGTSADAKGFGGLKANVDSTMIVNAAGSGSDCTHVFAVRTDERNVALALGNEGRFDTPTDVTTQQVVDGDGNYFTAYCTYLMGRVGLQLGHAYSFGAIKNVEPDAPCTDDLIAELWAKFKVGGKPNSLLMSRRSQQQLQKSRTATNPTGAPAPFPDNWFGTPIVVTDSIVDTETNY